MLQNQSTRELNELGNDSNAAFRLVCTTYIEGYLDGISARGVKQELYAHVLLINIASIFESEVNDRLPPSSTLNVNKDKDAIKQSYWRDFFGEVQAVKINFKNRLLVIGRHIETIVMTIEEEKNNWIDRILNFISRIHQKIRPGRHYPRQSRKPYTKWQSSNASKKILSIGA